MSTDTPDCADHPARDRTAVDPAVDAAVDAGGTEEAPRSRDYVAWHDAYRDPTSALSVRLRHVQQVISEFYDHTQGSVRVLSSCAGQGADILGVLEERPELRARTSGALVELLPENCAVARQRIATLGVELEVEQADASVSDTYAAHAPADLVLLSGIMGNISAADIERLVRFSPALCRPGATVIWTRGAQEPDLGPDVSRWFAEAGFEELAYLDRLEGTSMRVGVERYAGGPVPIEPGVQLFTFFR